MITLTVSNEVTEPLSTAEIDEIIQQVYDIYDVQDEDVTHEVEYKVTATLDLEIPEGVSQEDVEEAVVNSIAEELGVHPKDVTILSVDMETGEVKYEISSDNYVDAETVQEKLNNLNTENVEQNIQEEVPGITVEENKVEPEIEVDITLVVDGSEVENIQTSNDEFENKMEEEGFTTETTVAIVTSLPTMSPIIVTDIPTAAPSITGLVVSISLSQPNKVMNTAELNALREEIASDYAVNPEDVVIEPSYTLTGTMEIEIPDLEDLSEEELTKIEETLEQSIADTLGLHPKDIHVTIDPETGKVEYTISVEDIAVAEETQDAIQSPEFVNNLNSEIEESNPELEITVEKAEVEGEIVMEINVTVNASASDKDLALVHEELIEKLEEDGFDVDENIAIVTSKPSLMPVLMPTSSIPTQAPSITGWVATIDAQKTVTESLTSAEIEAYEESIKNNFNVTDEEVETTITYSTTGTMEVEIPLDSELTPEEIEAMVEETLASELGVHPQNVEVEYDEETNTVTFTITSEDAESLVEMQDEISKPEFQESLKEDLEEKSGITVTDIAAPTEVIANVEITVDATNTENREEALENVENELESQGHVVESTVSFVTSAPTFLPTIVPTVAPVTTIPTAAPSLIGFVSTVTAVKTGVTEEIFSEEVENYVNEIAEYYGVDPENITASVVYTATGSMVITIPEDITDPEILEEAIKESLAESLNTHPSNIEVEVDMETGEVTFTVTSDELSDVQAAQFNLQTEGVNDEIKDKLAELLPGATIEGDINVDEEIIAELEIIVDSDEAENDLTQAAYQSERIFDGTDFENVQVENKFVTSAPSVVPSGTPITSIPTIAPSITGAVAIIDLSQIVTEEISTETIDSIKEEIVKEYGVDEEDVEIEITYVTNGTMDIGDIPEGVDVNELAEALEMELAELLGLHENEVNVTIAEDGTVYYMITSDSFEEANDVQDQLNLSNTTEILNEGMKDTPFGDEITIQDVEVADDITTEINIVVDVTDAENNLGRATENIEQTLESDEFGFEAEAEHVFITAGPTSSPTIVPSEFPTTSIPSARPTITGEVWEVELTGTVDEELSEDQIDEIEKQIANEFGVDEEDIEIETKYVTEGNLDIIVPENVDEEKVIEALTDSLAEMFDVHPKDVLVTIDSDGTVSYEITSGNYTEVEDILNQMNDPNFANDLTTKIEETNSEIAEAGVVVNDVTPSENIEAVVSVIIDGTDATAPEDVSEAMNEIATNNGLDSVTKVDYYYITSAPTFVPSISPVTSLPTATPTITGLVHAVEISTEVTSALTPEEIAYLESVVIDSYKVDPEDVSTVVEYVSTGSLILDNIPEDMTEEEIAEILTDILSTTLGVEPEDITITFDPETGKVDYMIIGNSFEETQEIIDLLNDEEVILDVLNGQVDPESGFTIASVDVDDEINAQVTVVVDGDNVKLNPQIAENMVDAMLGLDYTVTSTTTFVTSAPTTFPSVVPSKIPSSSVPTQRPTITGDVVFVDMEKLVNSDLSTSELEDIIQVATEIFDLYPENVQTEVSYKTYGEIEFDVTEEIEPEELEEALEEAIAETLGIHPSNVEVTVNEDGTASYVITSDNFEDANSVQEALLDSEIEKDIEAKVVEDVPAISGLEVKPEFGVYAIVELVIDTTNTGDIDNSVDLFDKEFNDTWSMGINSNLVDRFEGVWVG